MKINVSVMIQYSFVYVVVLNEYSRLTLFSKKPRMYKKSR